VVTVAVAAPDAPVAVVDVARELAVSAAPVGDLLEGGPGRVARDAGAVGVLLFFFTPQVSMDWTGNLGK